MNSIFKKAIAAIAVTKGIEKIQDMRRPKRSFGSRISPVLALAGLGAGVFYLSKTGRLQPLIARAKAMTGGDDAVLEDSLRQPASATTV